MSSDGSVIEELIDQADFHLRHHSDDLAMAAVSILQHKFTLNIR